MDKAFPAELLDGDKRSQFADGNELSVFLSFEELSDEDSQAVAGRAEGQA